MADTDQGLTTADIAGGEPQHEQTAGNPHGDAGTGPLLPANEAERYDEQWRKVQASFVDHPRQAVEEADGLVADLMKRLATEFTETRLSLEEQWERAENVSTEELRVAMTRYRSFFERLLTT
jgi:hypothetical protein